MWPSRGGEGLDRESIPPPWGAYTTRDEGRIPAERAHRVDEP